MRNTVPGTASPGRMVARGLARHCARCGGGHLFSSWFRLRERCPACGMRFEREEGFWLGGYVINFGLGEAWILVFLAVLIGVLANGGTVNLPLFLGIGLGLAVIGPILTFPHSRTIWSSIDLIMRPLSREETVDAQAAVAAAAMVPGDGDDAPGGQDAGGQDAGGQDAGGQDAGEGHPTGGRDAGGAPDAPPPDINEGSQPPRPDGP